jgi:hypothetical protein
MEEDWGNYNLKLCRVKLIVTALSLRSAQSPLKDRLVRWSGIASLGAVHTAVQVIEFLFDNYQR